MERRHIVAVMAVLCVLGLSASIGIAFAGNATSVSECWAGVNISDHSGTVPIPSTVYIYWNGVSPASGTVDVQVLDPDGNEIASWVDQPPSASGTHSFSVTSEGSYVVILRGWPTYHVVTTIVASASVFAVPESAFGALAAIGAGFAAVGIIKLRRRN